MRSLGWCLGLSLLAACGTESAAIGCKSDSECDAGLFCDLDSKACRCRTDDACGAGRYCNPFGSCQDRPPCLGNIDCAEGMICNSNAPNGGTCIPNDTCGSNLHCEFNHYCFKENRDSPGVCKPGCRLTGDCELGFVCSAGACVAAASAGDCSLCPANPDPDAHYCDYGEYCTADGGCVSHAARDALCQPCKEANPSTCGANAICLRDNERAGENYCAPRCKLDRDCPNGYAGCGGIAIVTKDQQCKRNADCDRGARCLKSAEQNSGVCECLGQDDCPIDVCLFGTCVGTRFSCQTDNDCAIECVRFSDGVGGTVGQCMTTVKGCGKDAGYLCDDLRSTNPTCTQL